MADRPILAIDVGNSRIKFGVCERASAPGAAAVLPSCVDLLVLPASEEIDWGRVTAHFEESGAFRAAIVAGANPNGVAMILSGWPGGGWPAPVAIRRGGDLPLTVNVDFPDKVGIDRLLDAVAANVLRRPDEAVVIVDSGTATTVDYLSAAGAFEGGAIMPGLELGARSLHQYTALLPLIDVPSLLADRVAPLGRNTIDAIRSGLWFGQIGAIRELVTRLAERSERPPLVLVTGGNGRWLAAALRPAALQESAAVPAPQSVGGDRFAWPARVRCEPDLALRALALLAPQV